MENFGSSIVGATRSTKKNRKKQVRKSTSHTLPPIGVFWDIENCQVPNGVSALSVVQLIRDTFFTGYTEKEFVVVCDVTKENAQIDLVHVASICKNAADEKLRQALRRFAERYGSPSAVILVSSDINFAADLSDLRHRKKIHVILLHQPNASEALTVFSNEHYDYLELTRNLPHRAVGKGVVPTPQQMEVEVCNLPADTTQSKIKGRLRLLSANCGGRVISQNNTKAVLRFSSEEFAYRYRQLCML
ncbi:hypothetical protein B566_EDAN004323 [Ephemera danica]|nr:hypothetical protein B566_EDAN004323 [Ephemera danica]